MHFFQDEMRNTLKTLKKKLDDKDRAAKAAIANLVVETATEIIQANIGVPVLVQELKALNNTKALDAALKKVKTLSPETSALFLSVDPSEGKIFALGAVPQVSIIDNMFRGIFYFLLTEIALYRTL